MTLDSSRLVELMSRFENGADLDPANPFADPDSALAPSIEAFVTATAADVRMHCPAGTPEAEVLVGVAIAGFLQGAAIGYEYAKRDA